MPSVNDLVDMLVKRICQLTRTADTTDLTDGEFVAVDKSDGYTRKMTVGNLATWVLGRIKSLSTSITAFRTGDVIPVDGPSGTAKMSKDNLLKETAENAADSGLVAVPDDFELVTKGMNNSISVPTTAGEPCIAILPILVLPGKKIYLNSVNDGSLDGSSGLFTAYYSDGTSASLGYYQPGYSATYTNNNTRAITKIRYSFASERVTGSGTFVFTARCDAQLEEIKEDIVASGLVAVPEDFELATTGIDKSITLATTAGVALSAELRCIVPPNCRLDVNASNDGSLANADGALKAYYSDGTSAVIANFWPGYNWYVVNNTAKTISRISYNVSAANVIGSGSFTFKAKVNSVTSVIGNTLYVGPGCSFAEIQDAIDYVWGRSYTEKFTIIVRPKTTTYARFSLIRKKADLEDWTKYTWSNNQVKNISIIGLDKTKCVVEDDRGEYETPPAEISCCNGLIANLSFICKNTDPLPTPNRGGYAVHTDAGTLNSVGYTLQFENCYFESDVAPAVGIGLQTKQNVSFKNCKFVSNAEVSYQPNSNYLNRTELGALYCHGAIGTPVYNQFCTLEHCFVESKESTRGAAYFQKINEPNDMFVTSIGTMYYDKTNGAMVTLSDNPTITPESFGNNVAALNS